MKRFLALMGALAVLGGCGALASDEVTVKWGNWVSIDGTDYREFFSPFPAKGSRWYSDGDGNCFVRAVVPMASLESIPAPRWFSVLGMGASPSSGGDGMTWGRWVLKDGRYFREFFPPVRVKGARLFSDPDGRCFAMAVVPNPKMTAIKTPRWFSKDGIGVAPWTPEETESGDVL